MAAAWPPSWRTPLPAVESSGPRVPRARAAPSSSGTPAGNGPGGRELRGGLKRVHACTPGRPDVLATELTRWLLSEATWAGCWNQPLFPPRSLCVVVGSIGYHRTWRKWAARWWRLSVAEPCVCSEAGPLRRWRWAYRCRVVYDSSLALVAGGGSGKAARTAGPFGCQTAGAPTPQGPLKAYFSGPVRVWAYLDYQFTRIYAVIRGYMCGKLKLNYRK